MTKVFAIFAGVFVVYIVLDWGMDITGRKQAEQASQSQEVGRINDDPILFTEFSELVRQTVENQKAQSGTDPNEDQVKMIREQVWSQVVDQKLYEQEIERLGITVTDQEIVDWVRGDNPPEFLKSQFTDSTGTFNRAAYEAEITNPKNKALLVRIEGFLRKQREREKLQSLILASVRVTDAEVMQKFLDQSITFDADYVLLDANQLVKDNEITFSDDDLRAYYNEHSEEFKTEATRKLKYVQFTESPSQSDSQAVVAQLQDIQKRAEDGADFVDLANTYSDVPPSEEFKKHGDLGQEKDDQIFTAAPGAIIGPVSEYDGYHLMKVVEFRKGADEFVRAHHILLSTMDADSADALKRAKELVASLKNGEDFATLAAKHSKDPGSGSRGGDLGWFGKGRMVKEFEDAAFSAKIGQIVGPVKTQFGYHIIKVTARDNREVKVIDLHLPIQISPQTRDAIAQQAQDFAFIAKEGDFTKEAQSYKYAINETAPFLKNTVIPGIGSNPGLNKFAFNGTVGDVSGVYSIQNGYAVAMISEVKEAGIRPFEEVRAGIEQRVKSEKKMEKVKAIAAELRKSLAPGDSLKKLASMRPDITVQHITAATAGSTIPGVGRDMGFVGGLTALNPGEISQPVQGQRGYFIIALLDKSSFDATQFETEKATLRTQLLAERRNRYISDWSSNLRKAADIVDNRDYFYR